ncbi:MAG: class III signal peptide-containing protein [archaeon]|nr:class III signal peptide-containing protein [archaeon]
MKGQGALEYLLLIGGGVLIAVIAITIILTLAGTGDEQVNNSGTDTFDAIQNIAAESSELTGGNVGSPLTLIIDDTDRPNVSVTVGGLDIVKMEAQINPELICSKVTGTWKCNFPTGQGSLEIGRSYTLIVKCWVNGTALDGDPTKIITKDFIVGEQTEIHTSIGSTTNRG